MHPIDQIAEKFSAYCLQSVRLYGHICHTLAVSRTTAEALARFAAEGVMSAVDVNRPELARMDLSLFSRCIAMMDEIRRVARRVFAANFAVCDPADFVFNCEVSFSFACKLLSCTGPVRSHFASRPSPRRIILAELYLASHTPLSVTDEDPELFCYEQMPSREELVGFR